MKTNRAVNTTRPMPIGRHLARAHFYSSMRKPRRQLLLLLCWLQPAGSCLKNSEATRVLQCIRQFSPSEWPGCQSDGRFECNCDNDNGVNYCCGSSDQSAALAIWEARGCSASASPPPVPACTGDDSKCSSGFDDCCACDASIGQTTCGWEEPATCRDGYLALPTPGAEHDSCEYSCYPPGCAPPSPPAGTNSCSALEPCGKCGGDHCTTAGCPFRGYECNALNDNQPNAQPGTCRFNVIDPNSGSCQDMCSTFGWDCLRLEEYSDNACGAQFVASYDCDQPGSSYPGHDGHAMCTCSPRSPVGLAPHPSPPATPQSCEASHHEVRHGDARPLPAAGAPSATANPRLRPAGLQMQGRRLLRGHARPQPLQQLRRLQGRVRLRLGRAGLVLGRRRAIREDAVLPCNDALYQ